MSDAPEPDAAASGLDERAISMLAFERGWWSYDADREEAIRERFGLSPADYHRVLGELISRPEALDHDPLLVRRLRRQRTSRTRERRMARRD
jgi:hypothetical protein